MITNRIFRIFFMVFFPAVLIINGCAALFSGGASLDPAASPDAVLQRVQANREKLASFSGEALMTVASPEGSYRATLTLRAVRPDSIWFKVEGPLGLDFASGCLSGDSGRVFVPLQNTLYLGSTQRLRDLDLLPLDLDNSTLLLGLVGLIPAGEDISGRYQLSLDKKRYRLESESDGYFWVDPRFRAVTRWEKEDTAGNKLWTWDVSEFNRIKSIYLPRMVRVTLYDARQQLTLFYDSMRPNAALKKDWFSLKIPGGTTIVRL